MFLLKKVWLFPFLSYASASLSLFLVTQSMIGSAAPELSSLLLFGSFLYFLIIWMLVSSILWFFEQASFSSSMLCAGTGIGGFSIYNIYYIVVEYSSESTTLLLNFWYLPYFLSYILSLSLTFIIATRTGVELNLKKAAITWLIVYLVSWIKGI